MNSRPLGADDHELSAGAPRVSARSRFAVGPSAASYAIPPRRPSPPGDPRAASKSKGGINGRPCDGGDDGDGNLSGSDRRSLSGSDHRRREQLRTAAASAASSNLSGSARDRDRPWRTASSAASSIQSHTTSGTDAYLTAEGDGDGDDTSLGGGGEGDDVPTSGPRHSFQNMEVQVTTAVASPQRWSQYETDALPAEAARATADATRAASARIAGGPSAEAAPLAGEGESPGAGAYRHDPRDYEGLSPLERRGRSPPPIIVHDDGGGASCGRVGAPATTADYVKSRLSALVAQRNGDGNGNGDYERQLSGGSAASVQSDHDRVRSEALKMLQIADSCLQDSPRHNSSRPTSPGSPGGGGGVTTGLFRTKGGGLAMRELHDDEVGDVRAAGRRDVASLAGLDRIRHQERTVSPGGRDGTFAIDSADEDDLLRRSRPASPNAETPARSHSAWSSRYSVERQLMAVTGGLDSTHVLAEMDRLHASRDKTKSARGLYRASADAMDGSHELYGDYTRGSSSTLGNFGEGLGLLGGKVWTWLRGTLWSDDPELNHDGTTQSLVRRERAMMRRKRFRYVATFLVLLGVAAAVLGYLGRGSRASPYGKSGIVAGERDVSFYVLADEPYDFRNTEQLTRELEALPADAEFVVHLGNANANDESMCQEYGFERAAAVLRESAVPVLVIPGDLDWAACGSKRRAERSLEYWDNNLGQRLTRHWRHQSPLDVEYADDMVGNFAFLHKRVLFVSVNMVDEETSEEEVATRLKRNVRWTRWQLQKRAGEYHAIVLLGHAPPSDRQKGFFLPVLDEIQGIGNSDKPVLYLHASARGGSFTRYSPFREAQDLVAVQLEQRGREAPMRVMVMDSGEKGEETFIIERREPTAKETE